MIELDGPDITNSEGIININLFTRFQINPYDIIKWGNHNLLLVLTENNEFGLAVHALLKQKMRLNFQGQKIIPRNLLGIREQYFIYIIIEEHALHTWVSHLLRQFSQIPEKIILFVFVLLI